MAEGGAADPAVVWDRALSPGYSAEHDEATPTVAACVAELLPQWRPRSRPVRYGLWAFIFFFVF